MTSPTNHDRRRGQHNRAAARGANGGYHTFHRHRPVLPTVQESNDPGKMGAFSYTTVQIATVELLEQSITSLLRAQFPMLRNQVTGPFLLAPAMQFPSLIFRTIAVHPRSNSSLSSR